MKAYDQGAEVRVTMSGEDVYRFAKRWPASGMRSSDRVSAIFDARNGDLVDFTYNGRFPEPDRVDGAALLALLEDAQNYAARTLGNDDLRRS